jgi:hypothetical protein
MKRDTRTIYRSLGTFDLTKKDLVKLEKLILGNITLTDHSDYYVAIGRPTYPWGDLSHVYSSARYIPDRPRIYRHAEIRLKAPNLSIRFSKLPTT